MNTSVPPRPIKVAFVPIRRDDLLLADSHDTTREELPGMSCNGCRVLRKGCSDSCMLRSCLRDIATAEAQSNATIFVAKFFGRAALMNLISAVPDDSRPALFQSLLFEACGRTINPVTGAVGLLWSGEWGTCEAAVETVLRRGTISGDRDGGSGTVRYDTCMSEGSAMTSSEEDRPKLLNLFG